MMSYDFIWFPWYNPFRLRFPAGFPQAVKEAKAERAELRDTVKDLLRSSPEAELPRHASQVMQAMRDMGGWNWGNWGNLWKNYGKNYGKTYGKPYFIIFYGKKHGKTMGIL